MSITAPPPPALLDYQAPPAPSEFDLELVAERSRWLRRRFLWFCAVNVILQIAATLGLSADIAGAPPLARFFNVLDFVLVVGGYAVAFVFALRRRPDLPALLRLGLYVAALLPCCSILFLRLDMSLNQASWAELVPKLPPGAIWALGTPGMIVVGHTVACMFIPWTVREALKPIAVVLAVNTLVISADLLFTIKTPPAARAIALCSMVGTLLLAPGPGLFICWWRFSRFRKRYRLVFESSGYRKLQHELAGARRVHEFLLPPQGLLTTGPIRLSYVYEPMRQIGGDILYVHPPSDPHAAVLSVVLVDVNGHGFGAALMANRVIGEIQRLFAEDPHAPPHQLLSALNRYVRLTMAKSGVFATAVCIRVDSAANTLQYANGGHPPLFLRRHADGACIKLDPDTYLLGVTGGDGDADYCPACQTHPFHPGDALLAYTDGATEARDLTGQMLTIAGLHDRLRQLGTPPDRWPTQLLHQVITHRRAPAEDDTLLVSLYRA